MFLLPHPRYPFTSSTDTASLLCFALRSVCDSDKVWAASLDPGTGGGGWSSPSGELLCQSCRAASSHTTTPTSSLQMTSTNNLNKFVLEAGPEDCVVRCRITRNCKGLDKGEWCLVTNYEIHQIHIYNDLKDVRSSHHSLPRDVEMELDIQIFKPKHSTDCSSTWGYQTCDYILSQCPFLTPGLQMKEVFQPTFLLHL